MRDFRLKQENFQYLTLTDLQILKAGFTRLDSEVSRLSIVQAALIFFGGCITSSIPVWLSKYWGIIVTGIKKVVI